jgi:hypothetical protein
MAKILITNSVPTDPILRQIPRRSANWCRHDFSRTSTGQALDAWIVYDNLLQPETNRIDRRRTMLVTAEPPSVRRYRSVFTSQFGSIRTSHSSVVHPNVVLGHEAQVWHYGMHPSRSHAQILDYDDLASMKPPAKTKLLSVISSNKAVTDDHRQRLRFVEELKSAFGDQIDVFGRGIRDIPDKADAIWDYQYHIALENDHSAYYMSEKLPDSFLGWSFPFYSGSTYADGVFPQRSFARIDMYDPARSIATIQSHIEASSYPKNVDAIGMARNIVLDKLNLFAVLCDAYDSMDARLHEQLGPSRGRAKSTTLFPKKKSVRLSVDRFMRAIALAS